MLDHRGAAGKRMWLGIRELTSGEEAKVTQMTHMTEKVVKFPYDTPWEKNTTLPVTSVTSVTGNDDLAPAELKILLEKETQPSFSSSFCLLSL